MRRIAVFIELLQCARIYRVLYMDSFNPYNNCEEYLQIGK